MVCLSLQDTYFREVFILALFTFVTLAKISHFEGPWTVELNSPLETGKQGKQGK